MTLKLGVIDRCRKRDLKKGRPKRAQKWCLYTRDKSRVLGRHPTKKRAQNQERVVQARKHGWRPKGRRRG